jgi:hypothetical protein
MNLSRSSEEASLKDKPVLYSTKVFVRVRRPLRGRWVAWHDKLGGGPQLVVREESLEVIAPQAMMLESRDILVPTSSATMWIDRVGWAGTPIGRRECIRLLGNLGRGKVELAISPAGGTSDAWIALARAGVKERSISK